MIDKHLSNNKNTGITSRNFAELFKFTSLYCFHKITDKFKMNNRSMNIVFLSLFVLKLQAKFDHDMPCETVSKINLVDLAGR